MIKKLVKKFFKLFSLEVKRINENHCLSAIDPIEYNSKSSTDKFFSDKKIEDYLAPNRISFYKETISLIKKYDIIANSKVVAGIGCGAGYLLFLLDKEYKTKKLHGFDFSSEAIKLASENFPKAEYTIFDITHDRIDSTFDIIFCTEVLEHLLSPNVALQKILSVLNPGGCVILTVPDGRKDHFYGHINFWSPESWKVFIEKNCEQFDCYYGLIQNEDNYAIVKKNNI